MPAPPVPAWYRDPFGRHEFRYWEGGRWTEHVSTRGHQSVDAPVAAPVDSPTAAAAQADAVASGARTVRSQPDWHRDPFGRHELRYWNGSAWTEHVLVRGVQGVDPPVAHDSASSVDRASKKVEKQVAGAGAEGTWSGGGTLFTEPVLVVNQKAKVFGSTLGYAVYNQNGRQLATIRELRRTLGTKVSDSVRGRNEANRAFRFQVVDMNDRLLLAMTRPEKWFTSKSQMIVEGPDGTPIGSLIQETIGLLGVGATVAHLGLTNVSTITAVGLGGFRGAAAAAALSGVSEKMRAAAEGLDKVGHVRFGLEARGQRLGSIHSQSFRDWNFTILDPSGTEVAAVTKTWAGWAKERFTKADNYVVQMHRPLEDPLRPLVIAAALVLDVALKQGDPTSGTRRHRRYA